MTPSLHGKLYKTETAHNMSAFSQIHQALSLNISLLLEKIWLHGSNKSHRLPGQHKLTPLHTSPEAVRATWDIYLRKLEAVALGAEYNVALKSTIILLLWLLLNRSTLELQKLSAQSQTLARYCCPQSSLRAAELPDAASEGKGIQTPIPWARESQTYYCLKTKYSNPQEKKNNHNQNKPNYKSVSRYFKISHKAHKGKSLENVSLWRHLKIFLWLHPHR